MRKLFLILIAILTCGISAWSQNRTITGTVTSADNGDPLVGATVMALGTNKGVATDVDGRYSITIPATAKTLRFSYVGMSSVDIPISGSVINASLENASTLNEVVVTGYGTVSKKAFTGALSSVSGAIIDKKADVNFVKGLEGNITGFTYNNSTSSPGTYGSVTIRGLGTLSSGSTPLYVVDGVPIESTTDGMSSSTNNYFDPMAAYNPNDIESVTVLKDAAATSIYGSRAANGVVVITTKKGGEGKFNLTLDVKQGFVQVANNNMKYANAAQTMDLFAKGYAARTGRDYESCYNIMINNFDWDGVTDTDWIDQVTRKGYFQEYNLSFGGTTGTTHYFASMNFTDAEGLVIGSDNARYSGRVNVDTKYKWFSAGVNASYSYSENNNFSQSTGGSMANPLVGAVSSMLPMYAVYNEDGSYANISDYNPVAVNDKDLGDMNRTNNKTFVGNPWLRVDFPLGIWAKTNFGVNIVDQSEYNYWSAIYNPQGIDYNGLGQKYDTSRSTLTWTNTLGWDYEFKNLHQVNLLLGQEMQRYERSYTYLNKSNFPFANTGMRDMTTAASLDGGEYYKEQSRLASYFVDARYSFDDRYFVSASFRRDGSSVFGANNRWGNFWSIGGKWRISGEKFCENATWLSNADVRISYGTVGNQKLPSLYAARGLYSAGYNYMNIPGIIPTQLANPDLSWETSKKFDVGFDLGFLNRINLTFDYYNEVTDDALFEVPLSMVTGQTSYYKNIGKILNRGVELGVNGVIFTNKDITVSAFVNMSYNKNKILKLADGDIEGTYTLRREGRPFRQFYMPEYAGVNPENGKALYYKNAEGNETTENFYEAEKRYVGQADPKFFGAFGANVTAYGIDFSLQFNYRAGNKVYDTGHRFTGWGMSLMTPLQEVVDNSWTPENPNAKYPQYIYGDPNQSTSTYSSRWLMDGDFLRLSNITLGYTLPAKITKKALMHKVRFYMTFDNVWTWTHSNFYGYNPETYASGVIAWQYPSTFTFTGGVQITF